MGPLARVALALIVLAAVGCGSASTNVGTIGQPGYDLAVTLWPEGRDGESRSASLTCDPEGGTHPDPVKACAALDAHPDALHSVPIDVACTEIYGGDQVAEVKGTGPEGATIRAVLNRTNGCEIARWDALASVVEPVD